MVLTFSPTMFHVKGANRVWSSHGSQHCTLCSVIPDTHSALHRFYRGQLARAFCFDLLFSAGSRRLKDLNVSAAVLWCCTFSRKPRLLLFIFIRSRVHASLWRHTSLHLSASQDIGLGRMRLSIFTTTACMYQFCDISLLKRDSVILVA